MASNHAPKRSNPFSRNASLSPAPGLPNGRPKSVVLPSPLSGSLNLGHNRNQSYSPMGTILPQHNLSTRIRSNSKTATPSSSTFAPSFINAEETRRGSEVVKGIEGENDFSGKRYVWLKDPQVAFVKGWIVEELEDNQILVQCDDGSVCIFTNRGYGGADIRVAKRGKRRYCGSSQSSKIRQGR